MGLAAGYDALSGQDRSFLTLEDPACHMHLGVTMVFESGDLSMGTGAIDFARIRRHVSRCLDHIPRYRQRLAKGLAQEALWVDDARFELDYHLRHVRLPAPGDDVALKTLCASAMSVELDRSRPLWEMWVVEGLADDRFAVINKTHHCLIDGLSGVEVMTALLSFTREGTDDDGERLPWVPRGSPTALDLLSDRVRQPLHAYGAFLRGLLNIGRNPSGAWHKARRSVAAIGHGVTGGFRLAADSPLNGAIGRGRRLEWLSLDLDEVKEVKNRLGGTVNDVVLATVAGALRSFLRDVRGERHLQDLRVLAPVSVRSGHEEHALGNRVSGWLVNMPVRESDPRHRLASLCEQTARLKGTGSAQGLDLVSWLGFGTLGLMLRILKWVLPFNLIVSNVRGPLVPLYLLGSRLVDVHPHLPLFTKQGLGIALFSYAGTLCWGFSADRELIPDLAEFRRCVSASFDELLALARGEMPRIDVQLTLVGEPSPIAVGAAWKVIGRWTPLVSSAMQHGD